MTTSPFSITQQHAPTGELRVTVTGDCDMSVAHDLSDVLQDAALRPGVTEVTVDLADTSFLDSHGIAALITGYRAATGADRGFAVINGHGLVQQVLQITGLADVLSP